MPRNIVPSFSSLESLIVPPFDFSFKDFEETFITGVHPNTNHDYLEDEQSTAPSTPRSARSLNGDLEQFSSSTSTSSYSPARGIIEPVWQSTSSHFSPDWTAQHDNISSCRKREAIFLSYADNNKEAKPTEHSLHRSFSMYDRVQYQALPTRYRPTIASSPWSCLEDAHHPLCTGSCDISKDSSSSSRSSMSSPNPLMSQSSTMFSADRFGPDLGFRDTLSVQPLRPLHHRCASAPEHTHLHNWSEDETPPPIPARNPRRLFTG